ncbi:MAG: hypothetical protein QM572_15700 [Nocardioides sp.]|uniref:hypothetical protein n=1 Tax=Nocardioides sp. TaxID=35761 RepID=UPI0039E6AE36
MRDSIKERRERAVQRYIEEERATRQAYGPECGSAVFGGHSVTFYRDGYVQVAKPFQKNAPIERLVRIEFDANIQKKRGISRGAAAALTTVTMGAPVNLLGSNRRGDVFVTITTDQTAYVLSASPPTDANLQAARQLEATGLRVLAQASDAPARRPTTSFIPTAVSSVLQRELDEAQKLRELKRLLDEGLINPAEHDRGRALVLGIS